MLTRTVLTGAAFAVAVSFASTAGAAGLFNFGQRSDPTVDPQTVQAMEARLESLEATVSSLSSEVDQLTAQVSQLQDILRTANVPGAVGAPAASPPVAVAGLPQLPSTGGAPSSVTSVRPSTTLTIIQAPPAQVPAPGATPSVGAVASTPVQPGPAISTTPTTSGIGTGARIGSAATNPAPTVSGGPLNLSALANGNPPTGSAPTGQIPAAPATTIPGAASPPGAAAPPPGAAAAPSVAAGQPATGVQTAALTPTGNAKADYDQSYGLITAGRYDLAETSFRSFLAAYPKNDLDGDAQYWLGESLFQRAKYSDAATVFRAGYQSYPKSDKAPDTLLALGQSLAGMGERDEACQIYAAGLKQYPALKQRLLTEQASAAC